MQLFKLLSLKPILIQASRERKSIQSRPITKNFKMQMQVLWPSYSTETSGGCYAAPDINSRIEEKSLNKDTRVVNSLRSEFNAERGTLVRRINSLEGTLEYQKAAHAEQLKGLHEEIKRLQSVCNDLTVKLTCGDASMLHSHFLDFSGLKKRRTSLTINASTPTALAKQIKQTPEKLSTENASTALVVAKEEPELSQLLTKQKIKYSTLLERAQSDIKRFKTELERSRAEGELLKEVLLVGCGIKFEQQDLRDAIQAFIHAKQKVMHRFPAPQDSSPKKSSTVWKQRKILPPISNQSPSPIPPESPVPSVRIARKTKPTTNIENQDAEIEIASEKGRIASALLQSSQSARNMAKQETLNPHLTSTPPQPLPPARHELPKSNNQAWSKKVAGTREIRKRQFRSMNE